LKDQLKHQHVAIADVPSFLKTRPEWSTHPIDGKPFQCEITVNTLGDHPKEQRFGVVLR